MNSFVPLYKSECFNCVRVTEGITVRRFVEYLSFTFYMCLKLFNLSLLVTSHYIKKFFTTELSENSGTDLRSVRERFLSINSRIRSVMVISRGCEVPSGISGTSVHGLSDDPYWVLGGSQ